MISYAQARVIREQELKEAGIRYAWIVTHEWTMDDDWDGTEENISGNWVQLKEPIMGPGGATEQEFLLAAIGTEFRLDYDGDGPAAKGRMWASDAPDNAAKSEAAFGPQDDFGLGNYGTAHLFFKEPDSDNWVEL